MAETKCSFSEGGHPDFGLLDELKSICLTMVAAGLDTLPGNINMTIAYLSSPHGQDIQKHMHEEIVKSYPEEDPWNACLFEEKSEFVISFVKVRFCESVQPFPC